MDKTEKHLCHLLCIVLVSVLVVAGICFYLYLLDRSDNERLMQFKQAQIEAVDDYWDYWAEKDLKIRSF